MIRTLICGMCFFVFNMAFAADNAETGGRIESVLHVADESLNSFANTPEGDRDANEAVIVRMRLMQINLREVGCDRTAERPAASPVMTSPTMFERTSTHEFSVSSKNCKVIIKTESCGPGFKKNLTQPTNEDLKKYAVCVKSDS